MKPSWKVRRAIIFGTLIYSAGMVAYLSIWADSSPLREQVVIALVGLAGSVIGAYIFGAVWDDKNQKKDTYDQPPYEEEGYE